MGGSRRCASKATGSLSSCRTACCPATVRHRTATTTSGAGRPSRTSSRGTTRASRRRWRGLARKEREIAPLDPDLVTATAFSALNQAFYDLLARREQVPVWRLFRNKAPFAGLPLYTTINRALRTRSAEDYSTIVGEVRAQGFKTFKCAPFEAVNGPDNAVAKSCRGTGDTRTAARALPRPRDARRFPRALRAARGLLRDPAGARAPAPGLDRGALRDGHRVRGPQASHAIARVRR